MCYYSSPALCFDNFCALGTNAQRNAEALIPVLKRNLQSRGTGDKHIWLSATWQMPLLGCEQNAGGAVHFTYAANVYVALIMGRPGMVLVRTLAILIHISLTTTEMYTIVPLYRWGNRGTGRVNNLPKFTQPGRVSTRFWPRHSASRAYAPTIGQHCLSKHLLLLIQRYLTKISCTWSTPTENATACRKEITFTLKPEWRKGGTWATREEVGFKSRFQVGKKMCSRNWAKPPWQEGVERKEGSSSKGDWKLGRNHISQHCPCRPTVVLHLGSPRMIGIYPCVWSGNDSISFASSNDHSSC